MSPLLKSLLFSTRRVGGIVCSVLGVVSTCFLQGSETTPLDVSNLVIWLDAQNIDNSDNSTLSNGSKILTWKDLSGNANDAFQSNTDRQPSLQTNQINGNPSVSFAGSVGLYVGDVSNTEEMTVLVVSHLPAGRASGRYYVDRWLSSHGGGIDYIDGFTLTLGDINTDTSVYGDSSSYPSTYSYAPTISVAQSYVTG